MCWAVPGKIIKIQDNRATVDIAGLRKQAALDLISQPQVGDYVLLHAGFAIQKVSEEDANLTIDFFKGRLKR